MTETGSRKFSASALSEKEPVSVKRVKNDDSDYSTADSSSESQDEGERLQRMTSAIRTIIEVRSASFHIRNLYYFFKLRLTLFNLGNDNFSFTVHGRGH
jgi:hypothetical protein